MIFVIPFIMGALAAAGAAYGSVKGSEGMGKMNEGKEIGERAQHRHEKAVSDLKVDWEAANRLAEVYGQLQIRVRHRTIGRFVAFIERIGQKASQSDMKFLAGLEGISIQQLKEYKTVALEGQEVFQGVTSSAGAGAAAGATAVGVAQTFGTVAVPQFFGLFSTNVAVSQLGMSGVAAWLGGGSMALGGAVLGGIALGPALAVGGFQIAGKGEEALTKAREYEAQVNVEVAKIEEARDFIRQVERRVKELGTLVSELDSRVALLLNELESQPFDRVQDAAKFQQVALLVKSLVEIMKTPVLDSQGNLNSAVANIQAKYRNL
ncbi:MULTISPECIES: hypothetical protein [unclassified Microcoleus]|uniref:hypothetical protein n=1 Tax=unclassified Microcoleus TaxID=2642155 RepID=UPI002FCE93F0